MYTNCHSYYSLRFGTFSEETLLQLAQVNEVTYLALTDINNSSACMNFIRLAKNYNIQPIVGIDIRNGIDQQYVILAKTNLGFQKANEFVTTYLHEK